MTPCKISLSWIAIFGCFCLTTVELVHYRVEAARLAATKAAREEAAAKLEMHKSPEEIQREKERVQRLKSDIEHLLKHSIEYRREQRASVVHRKTQDVASGLLLHAFLLTPCSAIWVFCNTVTICSFVALLGIVTRLCCTSPDIAVGELTDMPLYSCCAVCDPVRKMQEDEVAEFTPAELEQTDLWRREYGRFMEAERNKELWERAGIVTGITAAVASGLAAFGKAHENVGGVAQNPAAARLVKGAGTVALLGIAGTLIAWLMRRQNKKRQKLHNARLARMQFEARTGLKPSDQNVLGPDEDEILNPKKKEKKKDED